MRKLLFLLAFAGAAAFAPGDEVWMGIYLQGAKIGYAYSATANTTFEKVPAVKTYSATVVSAEMLGQSISQKVYTTAWSDRKGRPIFMKFDVESGGRSQLVDARFVGSKIKVQIDNSGSKSTEVISIPPGANVVDDAIDQIIGNPSAVGKKHVYYELDPMTVALVKDEVTVEGKASTTVNGKDVIGNKVEISQPSTTSYCYFTSKGDLIKVEGPMGIEMVPETKLEALSASPSTSPTIDLASESSITPNKPIADVDKLKELDLMVTGHDLSSLPSDAYQTVTKSNDSWLLRVHPVNFSAAPATIEESAKEQPDWTKPSLDIPSDNPEFVALAQKVTAGAKNVETASRKVHDYVYGIMKPDAGIGVLRNAAEILKTKEGVCRDYAVLTATLLRADRIPTKLVSGLEYAFGAFYYHAWVEVWDGKNWVGVDSTLPDGKVTASHIQLAEGNVEQAFAFTFLDKVKVEVLDARRA